MPPKSLEHDHPPVIVLEDRVPLYPHHPPRPGYPLPPAPSPQMATQVQMVPTQRPSAPHPAERMRLPPILPYQSPLASPGSYPPLAPSYSLFGNPGAVTSPRSPYAPSQGSQPGQRIYSSLPTRQPYADPPSFHPPAPLSLSPRSLETLAGQKRPYQATLPGTERAGRVPLQILTPSSVEPRDPLARSIIPSYSSHSSISSASTPTGIAFSNVGAGRSSAYSRPPSEAPAVSNTHRCSLFIRQQPRAARAGPDGKDRRALDPPPILQLLLNDFDPTSTTDIAELKSTFIVHCRLISAQSPRKDLSTLSSVAEDGSKEIQRLLLGTAVSSPFFVADDPDPETMPPHPTTMTTSASSASNTTSVQSSGPPSPTSRFIQSSSSSKGAVEKKFKAVDKPSTLPGTFFIFADLSVRKAGEYRLEFSLMKMDPLLMIPGNTLPSLHSVTSQVFKVVNAKDFDQVQPSTNLVKGLLERGAGFPLKLKKGTREGQRRPRRDGSADDDEDEEEDEEE